MPYLKIHYSSSHNISVSSTDYIEIEDSDIPDTEEARQAYLDEQWTQAVCEYMADTYIEIVESQED